MKECPYCKSEIKEDAKVCPQCKRRIIDGKEKKKLKKVAKIIWGLIFVLIVIIVIASILSPSVEENCNKATEITLKEVQDKISENHQSAESTYNGNYYKLSGKILHIYSKEIEIQDIDDGYSIFVKFNSKYNDKILDLKVGDTIKYCGKFKITSSSYKIENACIIIEND